MNQINLCGYLTKNFELIQTQSGLSVARNYLAINETRKAKNGNSTISTDHTNFIPIVLFGKKAETAHQYLTKGDKFLGTGKLETSSYTDEGGQIRYTWQVIINHFEFVNGKKMDKKANDFKEPPKELDKSLPKKEEVENKYVDEIIDQEPMPF